MAKTEITKILFRRGEEKHRRSLYPYGGLDNGEPGWTSVSEKESAQLQTYGINPHFPDLSDTVYATTSGLPTERSDLGFIAAGGEGAIPKGMCDLWIGGGISEENDIYIGGQSAEFYNQMRFVSLSGTDLNHPHPYVQGNFTIGKSGDGYQFQHYGPVTIGAPSEPYMFSHNGTMSIDGDVTIGNTGAGHQLQVYSDAGDLTWDSTCGILNVNTDAAIKIPVGDTDARPSGTASGCLSALGMIRYNSELMSFEGLQGTDKDDNTKGVWSSIGGLMSKDRCTYITAEEPSAPDGNGNKYGLANQLTFITGCTSAGYIDSGNNLVINGDIVAFNASDHRQKDQVTPLVDSLDKLRKIDGVSFIWNENCSRADQVDRSDVGVIAQQVQEVLPEAVKERDDGYMAVDYYKLVPLLIESIKQLEAKVDALQNPV